MRQQTRGRSVPQHHISQQGRIHQSLCFCLCSFKVSPSLQSSIRIYKGFGISDKSLCCCCCCCSVWKISHQHHEWTPRPEQNMTLCTAATTLDRFHFTVNVGLVMAPPLDTTQTANKRPKGTSCPPFSQSCLRHYSGVVFPNPGPDRLERGCNGHGHNFWLSRFFLAACCSFGKNRAEAYPENPRRKHIMKLTSL